MARYQLIHNGDIKEYYDDQSEWTAYACNECGGNPPNTFGYKSGWQYIEHTKECKTPKKWAKEDAQYNRETAAKERAMKKLKLAKLTKLELKSLGIE
jgi:predicted ATP-dependent serine protease